MTCPYHFLELYHLRKRNNFKNVIIIRFVLLL